MNDTINLDDFPIKSVDKLRYCDTDRQGHINNAVFSMALETGRTELLCNPAAPLAGDDAAFVIAKLEIEYLAELTWPGEVHIGTSVEDIGRSSCKLWQALFQNDRCVAVARSVIVQMDDKSRKSRPLDPAALARLRKIQAAMPRAGK